MQFADTNTASLAKRTIDLNVKMKRDDALAYQGHKEQNFDARTQMDLMQCKCIALSDESTF